MTVMRPIEAKREAKRQVIVAAAMRVLLRDGLRGCTARAVADESPLTKSAINYYFESIDEVIDAAMSAQLEEFFDKLRAVAAGYEDPRARLWAVLDAYREFFAVTTGSTRLWFAYWLDNLERNRAAQDRLVQERVTSALAEVLSDAGAEDAATRAQALFSYLIGMTIRHDISPISPEQMRAELASLSGFDR